MKRSFQIVHYTPDHFLETRFAVGAIVHHGDAVRFLEAPRLPHAECLGSKVRAAHLQHIIGWLRGEDAPGLRSPSPDITFTDPRAIPESFGDPFAWVSKALAGEPEPEDEKAPKGEPHQPSRRDIAKSFFRSNGVADLVRSTFQPGCVSGVLENAGPMEAITQWIVGPERLLLVEPIVTSRSADDFEHDLAVTNTRFAAYRHKLALDTDRPLQVDLVALVLGNSVKRREKAAMELKTNSDTFVEAARKTPRTEFIATIRSVAPARYQLRTA